MRTTLTMKFGGLIVTFFVSGVFDSIGSFLYCFPNAGKGFHLVVFLTHALKLFKRIRQHHFHQRRYFDHIFYASISTPWFVAIDRQRDEFRLAIVIFL